MNPILRSSMRLSGIIASAVFWISTFISIIYNPWFSFYVHAFSDLGGPGANHPQIYNTGLIISALFVALLSIDMVLVSKTRVGIVGGSYLSISSIFLAMIGIFHAGTYPHVFVSTWFFIQAFIGFLIFSIGEFRREPIYLTAIAAIFLAGLLGALLIKWPSAATIESYEIILLTAASIVYVARYRLTDHG